MNDQMEMIAVDEIHANTTAIREVDKEGKQYQDLQYALSKVDPGTLINPIIARTEKNEADGTVKIILVEGLHRLTAARELKWSMIPCIVHENMSRKDAMSMQLRANAHRIAQKPAAEGNHYRRMQIEDPELELQDLAELGGTTVETIKSRLRLAKNLSDKASILVDNQKITLRNAQTLIKLDKSLQDDEVLTNAQAMKPDDFHNYVTSLKKEISGGSSPKGPREFQAVPKLRKRLDIESEIKTGQVAKNRFKTAEEQKAFIEGLKYTISMDEQSVAVAKEKYELKEAERKKETAKRKKEIAQRRQDEAEKAAKEAEKLATN